MAVPSPETHEEWGPYVEVTCSTQWAPAVVCGHTFLMPASHLSDQQKLALGVEA